MALKLVAVEGLTLLPQGIVSGGIITQISVASLKVNAGGSGVHKGSYQFTVAGANAVGYDPGTVVTVGTATISPTAIKAKADGSFVMRQDDQNPTVAMTGTIGGTPTPFVEPWKITVAGQIKVSAE